MIHRGLWQTVLKSFKNVPLGILLGTNLDVVVEGVEEVEACPRLDGVDAICVTLKTAFMASILEPEAYGASIHNLAEVVILDLER